MKAILISIKPKYVAEILNHRKTIEVRKTAPKCGLPIEVYIYCTKKEDIWRIVRLGGDEFICKKYPLNEMQWKSINEDYSAKGKIVAKFTLRKVEEIKLPYTKFGSNEWVGCEAARTLQTQTMDEGTLLEKSCLEEKEIYGYLNFKYSPIRVGYAWHIEDLIIFDKPMEIDEFDYPCPSGTRYIGQRSLNGLPSKKHPPQSWCYVEERK